VSRREPVVGGETAYCLGQGRDEAVEREGFENDTGGKRQYLLRFDLEDRSKGAAGLACYAQSVFACAGIGVTGVDDKGANTLFFGKVRFTDLDGGCAEAIEGEDTRYRGARGQSKDGQVAPVGFAYARFGGADFYARNREYLGLWRDVKIDGHSDDPAVSV
jgi:hypothetical protein